MAIPESQLEIWAKQGSVTQSQGTYSTVKSCLEASDAPYYGRSSSVFLQGSYGNDTNIYADSDVDVVILTDSIYYDDIEGLSTEDQAAYKATFVEGSFTYVDFKAQVISHLTKKFGTAVKSGKKAIFIEGNGSRRDADVLPAVEHRRYTKFNKQFGSSFDRGICFWTEEGVKIINYPKQHSANCTDKHKKTLGWYKPCVRILKNNRNAMIASGLLKEGLAPSYFLEGMLYNVPNSIFGESYQKTIADSVNWIINCDRDKLICANEQYYLLNLWSPVTWRSADLNAYFRRIYKILE